MRNFTKIITLAIFLTFSFHLHAGNSNYPPDSNIKSLKLALSLVPSYTLQNGFRVDLDYHLCKNQWLVFGPHYFIARGQYMDLSLGLSEPTDMDGFGFDLYHKLLLKSKETVNGPYFAYGIRYDHFSFKYNEYDWVKKTDGWGTPYYEWAQTDILETNNRYAFNLLFGLQYAINNKLLIDGYTGCGIQVSDISPANAKIEQYSNFFLRYNYSGPRFLLGFRLGLFLF